MSNTIGAPAPAVFSFNKNQVRMVSRDGEPWFCAKDVAESLEFSDSTLKNIAKTFAHLPEEWKGRYPIPTPGGEQELLVISEQGLYFFLGRSDKPKALPFQMWLAGDVLPTIRKTGKYETQAYKQNRTDTLSADEAQILRDAMKSAAERLPKDQQGRFMMSGWAKLKAHFKVSYRNIPAHEFEEALSLISRHIAGAMPAPQENSLDLFERRRWLAVMEKGQMHMQEIPKDAYVATEAEFAKIIQDSNSGFSKALIPGIIAACAARLGHTALTAA